MRETCSNPLIFECNPTGLSIWIFPKLANLETQLFWTVSINTKILLNYVFWCRSMHCLVGPYVVYIHILQKLNYHVAMPISIISYLLLSPAAFSKKNGLIMPLVQNPYQAVTPYRFIYFSTITLRFSEPKMQQFWRLTKKASSQKMILFKKEHPLNITKLWVVSRLQFLRIRCRELLKKSNSFPPRRIDVPGLSAAVFCWTTCRGRPECLLNPIPNVLFNLLQLMELDH